MACYEYQPLDLSTNQIRLLRLRQGYHTDKIECEIFETYLNEAECVPYEALSYTWGNESEPAEIKLNGGIASVTWNLYMALNCLRSSDRDRLLWVDALCINQANDQERGHQVSHMKEIYQNAEQVLIWLGRAGENVNHLMDLMTQLERRAMLQSNYRKQSPKGWREVWPHMVEEQGGVKADIYLKRRGGLIALLQRPWFQRVWVLQEAASARRATVVCGWRSISSRTFVLMPSLMDIEPDAHSRAVLELMPGHQRRSRCWSGKHTLETLLWKFKSSRASDPRDRVYALLGISSDANQKEIFPANYELDVGQMVQNTISYLLFGKLYDPSTHGLPVWHLDHIFSRLEIPDLLTVQVFKWALVNDDDALALKILDLRDLDINQDGSWERTPLLMLISQEGHGAVLNRLLARDDLNINVIVEGYSALHRAVETGFADVVDALLTRQDIVIEAIGSNGFTPLTAAAEKGNLVMAKLLLDHGADAEGSHNEPWTTPLWVASTHSHTEVVKLLLERGAQVDAKDARAGSSPLFAASELGDVEVMTLLLDGGADTESQQLPGRSTPLACAVENRHWNAVNLLLDRGSSPFSLYANGEMVIHKAAGSVQLEFLKILHRRNIPMDTTGRTTPLHVAAKNGQVEEMKFLLSIGADVNRKDHFHQTPLIEAVTSSKASIAKILLEHGADVDLADGSDQTPLMLAASLCKPDTVRVLLDHGADPNLQDADGKTALMFTVPRLSIEWMLGVDEDVNEGEKIAMFLLESGADVNCGDNQGRTALSWAAARGFHSMVRLLLMHGADKAVKDHFGREPLSYS